MIDNYPWNLELGTWKIGLGNLNLVVETWKLEVWSLNLELSTWNLKKVKQGTRRKRRFNKKMGDHKDTVVHGGKEKDTNSISILVHKVYKEHFPPKHQRPMRYISKYSVCHRHISNITIISVLFLDLCAKSEKQHYHSQTMKTFLWLSEKERYTEKTKW